MTVETISESQRPSRITPRAQAVFMASADWLEANPDKHIIGAMATNASGRRVPPTDPEAECFCALGRIAKEADLAEINPTYKDLEPAPFDALDDFFRVNVPWKGSPLGYRIYTVNDSGDLQEMFGATEATIDLRKPRKVIEMLRQIARGEITE